ncbi:hypothetical protein HID58_069822 [Brassica napus]|uniref:NB-ARC domain-containing protein n=1 Tax=Brassica napus TaxID=3708 RepID=A0ABQ7YX34_BRANA|nr:hypothetical protein HID58_069822 [Brassica napus]
MTKMGGCVSLDLSCDQALNQTCNCLFGDRNYIHMMKTNLDALETAMQEFREKRDDIARKVSIEEDKACSSKGWRSRVASIDSQVSDLHKSRETETKRLCLFRYFSKNCISSCKYGKDVSKNLIEVKELLSKGVFEELAVKKLAAKVVKKEIQATIGLDSMVGKAWDSIMKHERRALGIYGMGGGGGGVGKTTLLTHINNKFDKEVNGFDAVIWVVVSQDLQYKGIQDQILRRLRVDKECENQTQEEKAYYIENILGRKKFILLLDDLWSEVDLNKIGVPRPTQENGSKIVFTTRLKEVCIYMEADDKFQIDCLSTNEAWELFRSIVGEDLLKLHQDIPTLAKQICEKCYGLPLALNVIVKAMSCKENVHEWHYAFDVLSTSSHEFPDMEEKILSRDEDGSNSQGHDIIGSLVRAHLLMECKTKSTFHKIGFTPAVKMHDVLREMALWIGSTSGKEEEKQCVKSGVKLNRIPDEINWSVLRRISLMRDNKLKVIPDEFFQFMPALVVLDLSRNHNLRELPEEICSLTSLQYLNLSYTDISLLSVGLKGLRKLISLDLEFTELKSIDGIGISLPNLQVKDALMLESIQRMERLANCIQSLWIFKMFAKALTLNTVALGGLRQLDIFVSNIAEKKIDWKNKEKEDLLCNSYSCFKHLSSISISGFVGPKELTWLLFAPNLKHLAIENSRSLKPISNVHPDMTVPFAKLQSLTLESLPELKRICSSPPALPSLKKFDVQCCPKMPKAAIREFQRHKQE